MFWSLSAHRGVSRRHGPEAMSEPRTEPPQSGSVHRERLSLSAVPLCDILLVTTTLELDPSLPMAAGLRAASIPADPAGQTSLGRFASQG